MNDVTQILSDLESGNAAAAEKLLPLVYDELRRLARARMANEAPNHTLQATALVHEAWIRLVDADEQRQWSGRAHFFAAAAEAMRRILIDRARRKKRVKHGGDRERLALEFHCPATLETPDRLLKIDEALAQLEREQPEIAELLKLRYYTGVSLNDAATLLNVSLSTAKRRWAFARAFLFRELHG